MRHDQRPYHVFSARWYNGITSDSDSEDGGSTPSRAIWNDKVQPLF